MIKFFKKLITSENKDIPPAYSPDIDFIFPTYSKDTTNFDYPSFVTLVQEYGSSYIFACISYLANCVRLYKPKVAKTLANGSIINKHDSKTIRLLKKPNSYYGFPTLLEATTISLLLTGNSYWEIIRVDGKAIGFFILQPQRMCILKDSNGGLGGYEYHISNGKKIVYKPQDIIHIKIHNVQDDFYGLSPLIAAKVPSNILNEVNKFLQNYFKNGAIFKGVLETEKQLTQTVYERLAKRFKSLYGGVGNAFTIPILEGGLKFRPVQALPKDSQAFESANFALNSLCSVLHIHPALLGFTPANKAILQELRAMFWEDTVVPFVSRIEEALNAQKSKYMPKNEQEFDVVFDSSQIEALKINELLKARIAVGYGALTINEVRARLFGLPPREDGDVALIPLNMTPTINGLDNTPKVTKPVKYLDVNNKNIDILIDDNLYKLYIDSLATIIETDLVDIFIEQFNKTANFLLDILNVQTTPSILEAKLVDVLNGSLFSIEKSISRLLNQKAENLYYAIINKISPENALRLDSNQFIQKFIDSWSKTLINIINDTTKKQIINEIIKLNTADEIKIKSILSKIFNDLIIIPSGKRLKTIGRTEAARIVNLVNYLAHKDAGFTHKIWHCYDCTNSRHKKLHGVKIKITDEFVVNGEKALMPLDVKLSANNVCNCTCRLLFTKEE